MAAPAYDQLLVVQGLDTALRQLTHKHAHHPLRGQIAEIEESFIPLDAEIAEIAGRQHELDRTQKRIDDEVALVDARRAEIEVKLYDGSVTGTKDLLAMQEESATLLKRKTAMEDDELEVMEQLEPVNAELAAARARRSEGENQITVLEAELAVELAKVEAETADTTSQRTEAAALVPDDLLAHYETLRHDFGGVAVARLVGSTCDGCHMSLSAVAVDQLKKQADDAVVTCPDCGRILIR